MPSTATPVVDPMTPTATPSQIRHKFHCRPMPGADAPRLETYPSHDDSVTPPRVRMIERCHECAAYTVDDVPVE